MLTEVLETYPQLNQIHPFYNLSTYHLHLPMYIFQALGNVKNCRTRDINVIFPNGWGGGHRSINCMSISITYLWTQSNTSYELAISFKSMVDSNPVVDLKISDWYCFASGFSWSLIGMQSFLSLSWDFRPLTWPSVGNFSLILLGCRLWPSLCRGSFPYNQGLAAARRRSGT